MLSWLHITVVLKKFSDELLRTMLKLGFLMCRQPLCHCSPVLRVFLSMSLYLFICLALGHVCAEVAFLDLLPLAVELNNRLLYLATRLHYQTYSIVYVAFMCQCNVDSLCSNACPTGVSTTKDDCVWVQVIHQLNACHSKFWVQKQIAYHTNT